MQKTSNFTKNMLDSTVRVVYNCKLLMMMGEYAPILFQKENYL